MQTERRLGTVMEIFIEAKAWLIEAVVNIQRLAAKRVLERDPVHLVRLSTGPQVLWWACYR